MPTYEYVCRDCDAHLEVVQSFRDAALTECTTCGGRLRKKFSAAGIVFKGSGYYVTDTRAPDKGAAPGGSSPAKDTSSTDSSSSKDSAGKDSGGKDAKPAKDAKPKDTTSKAPASSSSTSGSD